MQAKVGQKVIYVSGRHGSADYNPLHEEYPEVVGEIIRLDGEIKGKQWVRVSWSNGTSNGYSFEKDLELLEYSNYLKDKQKLNI